MKHIRKGNDIKIRWKCAEADSGDISFFIVDSRNNRKEYDWDLYYDYDEDDNEFPVVEATFRGTDQKYYGTYHCELWENYGGENQRCIDKKYAFCLVDNSEDNDDNEIDIDSDFSVGVVGDLKNDIDELQWQIDQLYDTSNFCFNSISEHRVKDSSYYSDGLAAYLQFAKMNDSNSVYYNLNKMQMTLKYQIIFNQSTPTKVSYNNAFSIPIPQKPNGYDKTYCLFVNTAVGNKSSFTYAFCKGSGDNDLSYVTLPSKVYNTKFEFLEVPNGTTRIAINRNEVSGGYVKFYWFKNDFLTHLDAVNKKIDAAVGLDGTSFTIISYENKLNAIRFYKDTMGVELRESQDVIGTGCPIHVNCTREQFNKAVELHNGGSFDGIEIDFSGGENYYSISDLNNIIGEVETGNVVINECDSNLLNILKTHLRFIDPDLSNDEIKNIDESSFPLTIKHNTSYDYYLDIMTDKYQIKQFAPEFQRVYNDVKHYPSMTLRDLCRDYKDTKETVNLHETKLNLQIKRGSELEAKITELEAKITELEAKINELTTA